MGRFREGLNDSDEAAIDMSPLIDCVFILLIFFIVTSTFLDEEGIEIATPQENEQEELTRPPPTLVLSVRNDGFVMVNNVRMIDPRSVRTTMIPTRKTRRPISSSSQ